MRRARPAALVQLLIVLAASGCFGGSTPPRYYTLTPMESRTAMGGTEAEADGPSVLLMPVVLPGYLDRQGIVTTTDTPAVRVAEVHRWAEPLSEGVSRVLARNLAVAIPSGNVLAYPATGRSADYAVRVDIRRFGGELGREAVLEAGWSVLEGDGKTVLGTYRALHAEPTRDGSHEALVAAMSRLLERLGTDMAATIREHGQGAGP